MWILQHVGLVPKNGHEDLTQANIGNVTLGSFVTDLLHPTTEVVQGIWVDVPVGDELGEVKVLKEIWLEIDVHCAPIQTSSVGTGCFSLLTKKTPLFLSGLGQSVWMIRWPAVFWEITWRMWMRWMIRMMWMIMMIWMIWMRCR